MNITGSYESILLPFVLPPHIYRLFLPKNLIDNWNGSAIFQFGLQSNAGPPIFKSSFQEYKLELPFLSRREGEERISFKHTLFFDNRLMAFSSRHITGLRSIRVVTGAALTEALVNPSPINFSIPNYIKIEETQRSSSEVPIEGWNEEKLRSAINSWWQGERTGTTLARFESTPIEPPCPIVPISNHTLRISLYLPSFVPQSYEELERLEGVKDGWIEMESNQGAWKLNDSWRLETKKI